MAPSRRPALILDGRYLWFEASTPRLRCIFQARAELGVGVETIDHPADDALVAHACVYFKAADLMTAQNDAV